MTALASDRREQAIKFRVNAGEMAGARRAAIRAGFGSVAAYCRWLLHRDGAFAPIEEEEQS